MQTLPSREHRDPARPAVSVSRPSSIIGADGTRTWPRDRHGPGRAPASHGVCPLGRVSLEEHSAFCRRSDGDGVAPPSHSAAGPPGAPCGPRRRRGRVPVPRAAFPIFKGRAHQTRVLFARIGRFLNTDTFFFLGRL